MSETTLNNAVVWKGRPHVLVYVEQTGKIKESKSEIIADLPGLIDIKPDGRLKPENQQADLDKKLNKFADEIADKFHLIDQQYRCVVLSPDSTLSGDTEFTCYASTFSSKLKAMMNTHGLGLIEADTVTPVLLIGVDALGSYRCIIRQHLVAGTRPYHPLDTCDVLGTLIPSSQWEQMTPVAREQKYYTGKSPEEFFLNAFQTIYDWTNADNNVIAEYRDRQ
jgi:hypothetical protein